MKKYTLFTVLGWEDRFLKSTMIILEKYNINTIILVSFKDYITMDNMSENKEFIKKEAKRLKINLESIELTYSDSINNWKILDSFFNKKALNDTNLINTTTFPRETIWTFLFFLRNNQKIEYIYFKPLNYSKDWLTKNHRNPRLLFKHSGIFDLNKKLALFIATGYDSTRMKSIIKYYEPHKTILLNQIGTQFGNKERNNATTIDDSLICKRVEIDSYKVDETTTKIKDEIKEFTDYNIIIASQGPKLSALSIYKNLLLSKQRIALAYVPVIDYNTNYSSGINDEYIHGTFEF